MMARRPPAISATPATAHRSPQSASPCPARTQLPQPPRSADIALAWRSRRLPRVMHGIERRGAGRQIGYSALPGCAGRDLSEKPGPCQICPYRVPRPGLATGTGHGLHRGRDSRLRQCWRSAASADRRVCRRRAHPGRQRGWRRWDPDRMKHAYPRGCQSPDRAREMNAYSMPGEQERAPGPLTRARRRSRHSCNGRRPGAAGE